MYRLRAAVLLAVMLMDTATAIGPMERGSPSALAAEPSLQTAPDRADSAPAYCVVDTGQTRCFSDRGQLVKAPKPGEPFFGQDAFYQGPAPRYRDHGDGTVSDLNTGLMWVQARGSKVTWNAAFAGGPACRVGGHRDWRMPTIKELYSLIDFNGSFRRMAAGSKPYLDRKYFGFAYGDESRGERPIDCQDWSATTYAGTTMNGNPTAFGVNFADGRIKGYPKSRAGRPGSEHVLYVRYVRGNPKYGMNDFRDRGDGAVTDLATGLMWSKADSGTGMNWEAALAWVHSKNARKHLGHDDWRLPNAKELQSLVDYTRAPGATDPARRGPAIDPVFQVTRLPDGEYPCFWSSTTHLEGPPDRLGEAAVYVAFGRALGWMQFPPGAADYRLLDVHGAGAQRSDPKAGDPGDYPYGRGPQGDVIRISNFVRLVRSVDPASVRLVQPDLTPMPRPRRLADRWDDVELAPPVKPIEVRKIVADGKHNAFTALARFGGRYWLAFRSGKDHNSADGVPHLSGHSVCTARGVTYLLSRTMDYSTRRTGATIYIWSEGRLQPYCELPSGGDCAYAAAVEKEEEMLVSYYSSHEGSTNIYLARVPLPK